jgi:hypothetical protein
MLDNNTGSNAKDPVTEVWKFIFFMNTLMSFDVMPLPNKCDFVLQAYSDETTIQYNIRQTTKSFKMSVLYGVDVTHSTVLTHYVN